MQANQEQEEEEECSICLDKIPQDLTKYERAVCCGKAMHKKCRDDMLKSSMTDEQKGRCVMCRIKKTSAGSKEEIERLRPWVEKGKAWAQSVLGHKYRDGEGVDQSDQQARELYELAVSQGEAMAQYNLGQMYYKGQGVDQSYERAKEYFEAAARQEIADAQFNLGALYANGQGVEQSIETARKWLMKAAEQGDEDAIGGLQRLDEIEGRTTPSFIPKPFECATCYRPHDPSEHKLRPCKRCHRVFYCGKECQMKHWKEEGRNAHKQKCNKKQNNKI